MRLLIAAPFLLLLILFALSNTGPVQIGIWPTGYSVEVPLSLAILVGMGFAFLVGGLLVWVSELNQRRRARKAEQTVRLLEQQIEDLKARAQPPARPALPARVA